MEDGNDVMVVPKSIKYEVIKEANDVGHFALQKTIHASQQQFWILHMERTVK